jgi:Flp pilus assembly protein TadD
VAQAAEGLGDSNTAENQYRAALELDPRSHEAIAGLANLLVRTRQWPKAEAALRQYEAASPQDVNIRKLRGQVLAAQGKTDEAAMELEAVLTASDDPAVRRELAQLYFEAKQYDKAVAQFKLLLQATPKDAELRAQFGAALLQQHQFSEAQQELTEAVKLKPDLANAYTDLAMAASENQDYMLTLRALDARATFLPELPGTYFLRATAYDHLKDKVHAAENYHRFLEVANGKFPDQEWQARHRLNAIEPKKR